MDAHEALFAELLQQHGVEPPRKISPTTGEEIWALAKGDRAFKELCADEDQPLMVQVLLAARVSAKSTLEETIHVRLVDPTHPLGARSNLSGQAQLRQHQESRERATAQSPNSRRIVS